MGFYFEVNGKSLESSVAGISSAADGVSKNCGQPKVEAEAMVANQAKDGADETRRCPCRGGRHTESQLQDKMYWHSKAHQWMIIKAVWRKHSRMTALLSLVTTLIMAPITRKEMVCGAMVIDKNVQFSTCRFMLLIVINQ